MELGSSSAVMEGQVRGGCIAINVTFPPLRLSHWRYIRIGSVASSTCQKSKTKSVLGRTCFRNLRQCK